MEELEEVVKELNWKEKIIVKLNKKLFKKVYNISRVRIINSFIK